MNKTARKIHSSRWKIDPGAQIAQRSGDFPGDVYHFTWFDVLCVAVVAGLIVTVFALLGFQIAAYFMALKEVV